MMKRLQQSLARVNWRFWIVCAACVAFLLLSGCGKNPNQPPQNHDYSDCWPCAVYEATFNAVNTAVEALIGLTCEAALQLLGIGVLFWILFHVMTVMTLQEPNLRKFILPMAAVFFKAIVISSLLFSSDEFIKQIGENLIQPVLEFFGGISKIVLDANEEVKNATQAASVASRMPTDSKLFGASEGVFLDIIYRIYIALHMGISLGFALWTTPGLSSFLFGMFVIVIFWMLLLVMPLSLLDACIRMAAIVILAPFCLVGWVFPPTKGLLKKLWDIFFGTGVMLFFICVYLSLMLYVVLLFTERYYPGILGSATQSTDPGLSDSVETLSTSALGFFVLILSFNKLSRHIPRIANAFGAQTVASSWSRAFQQFKKLAVAATKAALAAALASPAIAASAAKDAKEVAQDTVKAAK